MCQIPDFRKLSDSDHASLLGQIFKYLRSHGVLKDEWLREQVTRLDKVEGDIEVLSKRLAFIRTWTFVSYKRAWTNDSIYWQSQTRRIENRLSDELHLKLTQRFVDRRTSILVKGLKQREALVAEINQNSEIFVENQLIGTLIGFCFEKDESASVEESKALRSTAHAVLGPQYRLRSEKLYKSSDKDFAWDEFGKIYWQSALVGNLEPGTDIFSPKVIPRVDVEAGTEITQNIKRRLEHFINRNIESLFEPLLRMQADESLTGISKGVAFRLVESLGLIPRSDVLDEIKSLEQKDRALLRKHGIRFGQYTIFHYLMLKPAPTRLRLLLWTLFTKASYSATPPAGLVSIPKVENATAHYYTMAGYKLVGERALRVDMLERLADILRTKNVWTGFEADVDMLSITGLTLEQLAEVLQSLGYSVRKGIRKKVIQNSEQLDTGTDNCVAGEMMEIEAEESQKNNDQKVDEVFFVFRVKKKGKSKLKNGEPSLPKRKKSNQMARKENNSSNDRTGKPSVKKARIFDPDNPFSALLELKRKL